MIQQQEKLLEAEVAAVDAAGVAATEGAICECRFSSRA